MFQCQTYKCTINANKKGEASLLKKKKKGYMLQIKNIGTLLRVQMKSMSHCFPLYGL